MTYFNSHAQSLRKSVVSMVVLGFLSSVVSANLVSDGDFSSLSITSVTSTWNLTSESLDQWYGYSQDGTDFYSAANGYATAATAEQSDRLLLQVIQTPTAGDYNFSFDYRLSDDSDMFSVMRVFEIDDDDDDFTIDTTDWAGTFTEVTSAQRIYDQGGYATCLSDTSDWTNVSAEVTVSDSADYIVIYAAFSHDGSQNSLENEYADIDNVVFTSAAVPEPSTICLLLMGGLMLRKRKN